MSKLLIVDDEQGMRQLLSIVFGREGHEVRVAENGRRALALLHEEAADLIVSDVKAGCGCTVADKPKEPIPPGGEGFIKANFDSKSQAPGNYNKTVSVYANTKSAPEHVLVFSAEVSEK